MKKVLIIEDDPIVAHVYRSRLEKEGFDVEVAPDGQTGYYRMFEWKPNGVLLDLMLPKLNGIDLLKKIRATKEFELLPVVVFTNAYVANMINEATQAKATAVYNKSSVTPRQIIDNFHKLINGIEPAAAPTAASTGPAEAPTEPAPPQPPTRTAVLKETDDALFLREQLASFNQTSGGLVTEMRKLLQEATKADEINRPAQVEQLYRKVRSFAANANMAGLTHVAKLGAAAEALLREMVEKPKNVTPSTLRTSANAIDFLGELSKPGVPTGLADHPPIEILIVDDEILSRRALIYALEKAFLKATSVEDAQAALAKAQVTMFDLIFLDVNMPGMDGFQLCDSLRKAGMNQNTPIIFVTSSNDFHVRAQSTLRGASDLIAKPFMFIELTVKALTFALRHRLEASKQVRTISAAKEVEHGEKLLA